MPDLGEGGREEDCSEDVAGSGGEFFFRRRKHNRRFRSPAAAAFLVQSTRRQKNLSRGFSIRRYNLGDFLFADTLGDVVLYDFFVSLSLAAHEKHTIPVRRAYILGRSQKYFSERGHHSEEGFLILFFPHICISSWYYISMTSLLCLRCQQDILIFCARVF